MSEERIRQKLEKYVMAAVSEAIDALQGSDINDVVSLPGASGRWEVGWDANSDEIVAGYRLDTVEGYRLRLKGQTVTFTDTHDDAVSRFTRDIVDHELLDLVNKLRFLPFTSGDLTELRNLVDVAVVMEE